MSLQPSNFETLNDFFTNFKHIVLILKQCKVDKEDDQLILAILSKLGSDYLVFVLHSMRGSSQPLDGALLIDSGASNHMMDERDSFSYLETDKSIPIHIGDDSTIILEGQGTIDLENGFFQMFCMYRLWHQISLVSIR